MENKYRLILENLMDGFAYCKMIIDNYGRPVDYVFLEVNQAFLELFNLRTKLVINQASEDVYVGLDSGTAGLLIFFSEAAKAGRSIKIEKYFKAIGKWLLITAFSIEEGCFVATYKDITYYKNSEEEHWKFFQLANDMFGILNLQGLFVELSPSWEKLLGYSRDEMLNKHFSEFLHPDDLDKTFKAFNAKVVGEPIADNFRNRYRARDGSYKWLSWNCYVIPEEGLIYATIRDITSIKFYEDRLIQSEERYRALVEASPFGIVVVEDYHIQFANEAALKLSEASSAVDMVNKSIFDFIPKDLHRLVKRRLKHILNKKDNTGLSGELSLITKVGLYSDFEVTCLRIPSEKNAIMIIIKDLSIRKHAEELRLYLEEKNKSLDKVMEYDRLKTDFFSNISHEFKTPLNVILGTLQLLNLYLQQDTIQVDLNLKKKFSMMRQNCYRLLRLVNNVIDITRIDSGYYEMQLANYDIVAIIKAISYSVKEYIEGKGIIFDFQTNASSRIIACDPDKVERIFLNLISNAIKFTRPGGKIEVAIVADNNKIKVSVKDTGIGIPKDKQDTIFNRFIQLDKSLTKSYEGSGIGLSLVESLVRMHNGKISVISQEGVGSEFIVELPYVTINEEIMSVGEAAAAFDCPVESINIEFSDIYIPSSR